jgi:hypothetical protein
MKLQVKFKDSASTSERDDVLAKLASRGAEKVDAVFPDSPEEHLRSLYIVDAGDRSDLLPLLEAEDAVEIAEPAVRRRPA